MGLFSKWKGRVKYEAELKTALAKLEFLSSEFVQGSDRKIDAYYWKQQLDLLEELADPSDYVLNSTYHSYRLLYTLYLKKNELPDDVSLDELLVMINKENGVSL